MILGLSHIPTSQLTVLELLGVILRREKWNTISNFVSIIAIILYTYFSTTGVFVPKS